VALQRNPHPREIRLEPLAEHHVASPESWIHDPDVLRFTNVPDPPPPDFVQSWFTAYEEGRRDGTREAFAILDEDGVFLGFALAFRIDREGRQVELGYALVPEARGRGAASRALALLTEWAFAELDVVRIELRISVANEASQAVARRCGYTHEGTLRSLYFKQGRRDDTQVWSRLVGD
jgi:RimJ/RimL family protein N-acetyltransferase